MYFKNFTFFIIFLFLSIISTGLYSQSIYNTDPNAPENLKPGGIKNQDNKQTDYIDSNTYLLGFYAGFGLTRQTSAHYSEGEIKVELAFQASATFWYFPIKHFGLELELGWQNFKTYEKDGVTASELGYDLQYLFLSIAPLLEFNGIYVSFGIYFGFILPGTDITGSESYDNSMDKYTTPDFGIKMTAGYSFNLSKKIKMFAGINMRAQVFNFRIYNQSGSKVIAFYANIGLLFNL